MGRKRSVGPRYGTEGGIAAFTLLVGLIVLVVLAGAYTVSSTRSALDTTSINHQDRLVSAQDAGAKPNATAAQKAQARARYVASVRRAVQRARARRVAARRAAARRAAMQARPASEAVTVTFVDVPMGSPQRSAVAQNLCGRLPRGGGPAGRQARADIRRQRAQALRQLGLHC